MFARLVKSGGIEDVGLGLNWDAGTLTHEVARRAAFLLHLGIGRGSVVAIAHAGTAYFFADLFATWSVGATAACLDVSLTPEELQNVVQFAKAAVLLVDRKATIGNVTVPVLELARARSTSASTIPPIDLDDPALILFTSGTTGTPKGVVLSFRALVTRITANIEAIGTRALARALVTLPTHFGHGLIGNALTPLLAGGDIVLHPLGIPLAHDLGRIVDEHNISFMSSVPTLWRVATTHSRPPLGGSLVRVHVGSAPLSASIWSRVATWSRAEVVNCYGITETANWISGASSRADGIAEGLVGKMWGGTAAVMDDGGSIRAAGDGEIVIRSPSLMAGYLYRPELTAGAVCQGWFRTGDRGSIDDRGCIWLAGRIREEINRSGFKVQPAEIDAVLESHPAVAEACVFGIADPVSGEAVAAAIRLASGASASPESLQAWCRKRMRRDAVPEHWFFVADIPRTSRGKISRDGVRRMLAKEAAADALTIRSTERAESQGVRTDAADTAAVISAVERAWTEVFGRHSYAANIAWDEGGGDSLDALRLWILIEEILGSRLPLEILEPGMTSSRLASAIEHQLRPSVGKTALNQLSGRPPVVIFMPPATGDLPMLARFRARIEDQIRFVVIQYPAWREMLTAGAGFDVLVDAAESQIYAECSSCDTYLLVGYSFGGFVARETARRLVKSGRRVSFLGLIDTRMSSPRARRSPLHRVGRTFRSAVLRPTELLSKAPRRIIAALISISAFPLLRLVGHLARRLPPKAAFAVHLELITQLRTRSLRRMRLKPLHVPTTLFRSDDHSFALPDYGWRAQCSQLTVIPIGGSHQMLFEPPNCDVLGARLLEAVEAASTKCLFVDGAAAGGTLDRRQTRREADSCLTYT